MEAPTLVLADGEGITMSYTAKEGVWRLPWLLILTKATPSPTLLAKRPPTRRGVRVRGPVPL